MKIAGEVSLHEFIKRFESISLMIILRKEDKKRGFYLIALYFPIT